MARRSFQVTGITEILVHWYAGRSQYELAESLGVDRKTIRKYLAPALAAGLAPGGPPVSEAGWAALVREWFPQLTDTRLRQVTWGEIAVHRDYIAGQLKAGVTKATIHQRLADEHGLQASLASLKRYVMANLPEEARRAQVTVLRDTPPPGAEAQIDYGLLGTWTDPSASQAAPGLGVRDGAAAFPAHVHAAGAGHGSACLDRSARGGVRVLRRGAGPAGPR